MSNEEKNKLEAQEEQQAETTSGSEETAQVEDFKAQAEELEANRKKAMAALGLLDETSEEKKEEVQEEVSVPEAEAPVVEEAVVEEVKVETPETATETEPVVEEVTAKKEVVTEETSDDAEGESDDQQEEEGDEEEDSADIHYEHLSLTELVTAAKELKEEGKWRKAEKRLKVMRDSIQKIRNEKREEVKAKFVEENGTEEGFEYKNDPEIDEFFAVFKFVRDSRKKEFEQATKNRQTNLKEKWSIVEQIKELTEAIDQKGTLEKVKALQKKFKEIGSVPATDAEDLYRSYEAVLDIFYDNKSIEFDLKELDRKKNLESKLDICERAEKLLEMEDVKEAAIQLNALHEEFKHVGPVPREEQENVWQRFKAASDKIYDKRRELAEEFKLELKRNMEIKQQLCLKVEPFANFDSDRIKEWNEKTKELLALQKEWEQVGALPREVAKDINRQFWGNFKGFFANKSKFFEALEASRKENLKAKEELCEKAEALQDSEEWKETTDALIQLQKEWKEVGPVPEKQREAIYQRFKAACDHFFDKRRNSRKSQDNQFVENLKAKEAICTEILADAKAKKFDLEDLAKKKEKYFEIGFVPRKAMDDILEKFLAAIDTYFENSPFTGEEREQQLLEFQADLFKDAPRAAHKLRKKEGNLRQKINNLENDIALWQNNLEFFANSKTADKLREDFNKKVAKAQKEIDKLKEQLKIVNKINY